MPFSRLKEEEKRSICKKEIENLEIWLRRLVHESLSKEYGNNYLEYKDKSNNYLIKAEIRQRVKGLINNEPKVLKGVIHSMKSSSYQIGATGLGDLAKKIEIFIAENNLKNIQPLIEEFIDECHGVNTKIQQYIDYNYKK